MFEEDKKQDYEEFNRQFDTAHARFVEWEKEYGLHPEIEVRAARFNHFITQHAKDFPAVAEIVSPDICKLYLERFQIIQRKSGAESKEHLSAQIDHLEIRLAYKEFRRATRFKGSIAAEVIAFQEFAIQLKSQELASNGVPMGLKLSVRRSVHSLALVGKVVVKNCRIASVNSLKVA